MIWLYIYLGLSALTFILLMLLCNEAAHEFVRRYPNAKVPKYTFAEHFSTYFRAFLLCFLPVFNLVMLFTVLFNGGKMKEDSIRKLAIKHGEM